MKRTYAVCLGAALAGSGAAFPLFPEIVGHDINFGAFNVGGPPEWATNGLAPDTLTYTLGETHHEATAYWPAWPSPPAVPIFGAGGVFGGDLALRVQFTGQDAPYVGPGGIIDVSLTGTGMSAAIPDLMIFGSLGAPGPVILLWAMDFDAVSLYGSSARSSYVLEGVGFIVAGEIAQRNNLIGRRGGMRGHLDFPGAPPGWIPALYHPLQDPRQAQFRAAYSGETGLVPEPASLLVLGLGGLVLASRRRKHRETSRTTLLK